MYCGECPAHPQLWFLPDSHHKEQWSGQLLPSSPQPDFPQPRLRIQPTMYLINCKDYTLEFHHGPSGVKYLILSHTWGDGEVTFKDMANLEDAKTKTGFRKIKGICTEALQVGVPYAWVDTCCIDKSSSAELSESINSMYHWYQCADRCIAYLDDLEAGNEGAAEHQLRRCRWFTRGWTLQELIAPKFVVFVDEQWNKRGTKESLGPILSRITRIDTRVLQRIRPLHEVAVAQRMSWAARRETTRAEDMAYCLLGIFDINMPLLYGEREKAFTRLQQAILQQTDDLSIFAWDVDQLDVLTVDAQLGYIKAIPFAPMPTCFRNCEVVERFAGQVLPSPSITITSAGVQLSACIANEEGSEGQLLHLQCKAVPDPTKHDEYSTLAIPLAQVPYGYMRRTDTFYPINPHPLRETFQDPTDICLVSGIHLFSMTSMAEKPGSTTCAIQFELSQDMPTLTRSYYPQHLWYPGSSSFYAEWSDSFLGAVEVGVPAFAPGTEISTTGAKCWVLCGMTRTLVSATEPGDNSNKPDDDGVAWKFWAAALSESKDGTLPELAHGFQGTRLRNPYTLSSVSDALRTKRTNFPTTCRVPYGNKILTLNATANTVMPYHREVIISATL
ncbi:heterokaryon incompatibility protein-domain-containing protein [Chaetomium sp. MPI-CAGE-AT-0009]|nr:heterokaryon incompatibility protein-domain-containing protein [Chaetomium sp. MPI-CAGE-AT-0009]